MICTHLPAHNHAYSCYNCLSCPSLQLVVRGESHYCQAASPSIASGSGGVPCPRRLLVVFVCLLAVGLCSWPLFLFLFVGLLPLLFLFGVSRWVEHLCIIQSLLQIKVAWGSGSVQPRGAFFSIIIMTTKRKI